MIHQFKKKTKAVKPVRMIPAARNSWISGSVHTSKAGVIPISISYADRAAVGLVFFMHGLCFASWASRIPTIQTSLLLSNSTLGTILLALPAGFVLSLPFAGWLVGILGSRKVVILSAPLYSASLLLIGSASGALSLTLALLAFGFFANQLNISINTQAVSVERKYGKRLMAFFHGLWSLAGFAGAAIGALMISHKVMPFQHYLFISIGFIIATVGCSFFLFKKDERVGERPPLFAIPDKPLVALGLIAFCSMMVEGAMFDWSGIYFIEVIGAEPEVAALGYTTFMVAMASMRFVADRISAGLGLTKILMLSGGLATAGLLVVIVFPYFTPGLMAFFLIGLGVSSVVPMVYSAAGKSKTLSAGTALTAVSSLGFMGLLIGPPLIGFVAEATGLQASFTVLAIMSITVMILAAKSRNNIQ